MSKNNISSQVGFLVPLNENLEEVGDEIPEIPIVEGANVVGRNCVPIADKRLSRKHLTLNADIDGSAEIFVVITFSHFLISYAMPPAEF
ncbi:hypothetical protein Leryth_023021 [Lithospermum erythrorhizon]|nr:hypothetical protein Leryth_023021 [Lithospermum erythrorhizon]